MADNGLMENMAVKKNGQLSRAKHVMVVFEAGRENNGERGGPSWCLRHNGQKGDQELSPRTRQQLLNYYRSVCGTDYV